MGPHCPPTLDRPPAAYLWVPAKGVGWRGQPLHSRFFPCDWGLPLRGTVAIRFGGSLRIPRPPLAPLSAATVSRPPAQRTTPPWRPSSPPSQTLTLATSFCSRARRSFCPPAPQAWAAPSSRTTTFLNSPAAIKSWHQNTFHISQLAQYSTTPGGTLDGSAPRCGFQAAALPGLALSTARRRHTLRVLAKGVGWRSCLFFPFQPLFAGKLPHKSCIVLPLCSEF